MTVNNKCDTAVYLAYRVAVYLAGKTKKYPPTFNIQLAFKFLFLIGFSTLSRFSQKGVPFACWACQYNERASIFFK
jgi:hypothetical protein